ncbi:MerR family transcriptional regulator (plasmid) [Rhizobium leguminosarum bv. viciae 248]|uniref:Transcriptional regulator n=1 Tax=Rhizobium leguminosarum TaxID=384 RepID=A0A1L3ZND3_RHILE|nr:MULTISPECIES: chaperone modulator CbpM [Rhizobium]API57159.1 transcriptional regulator [Rhizobium leguminosarum]MBY3237446.1 MerR family transcriptional regulator [Rhizobium laguerreae]MBY3417266.1 MerR family transcriptional regulator [Rhizobium laguerreae]MBY3446776.1 MerR family transcriptional regulator [Rhizobium laguerreae]MBY3488561.1 MerR family transcriptional regulator [Rhizobium laguerreae]
MDDLEFRLYLKIDIVQLDFWIEQGWLIPETSGGKRQFRDADVARARLILDLMGNMGVNEAGVDIVMELVDELHGLRGTMGKLMTAIGKQEQDVQRRLFESLEEIDRF